MIALLCLLLVIAIIAGGVWINPWVLILLLLVALLFYYGGGVRRGPPL